MNSPPLPIPQPVHLLTDSAAHPPSPWWSLSGSLGWWLLAVLATAILYAAWRWWTRPDPDITEAAFRAACRRTRTPARDQALLRQAAHALGRPAIAVWLSDRALQDASASLLRANPAAALRLAAVLEGRGLTMPVPDAPPPAEHTPPLARTSP